MIETIKGVKNPLTIIAIFAGLAEISGTGVLPFITESNQTTYIWFLMIFPIILITLFFVTLNFNSKVLYSPSDFRDEENYMRIFQPASVAQKILKMQNEIDESVEIQKLPSPTSLTSPEKVFAAQAQIDELLKKDPRARYQLVEEIIVNRLAREFNSSPQRDMSLRNKYGGIMFDAVFDRADALTVVEVKVLSDIGNAPRYRHALNAIAMSLQNLPDNLRRKAKIIFAVAYDLTEDKLATAKTKLEEMTNAIGFPVEIRWYALADLLKEIETK